MISFAKETINTLFATASKSHQRYIKTVVRDAMKGVSISSQQAQEDGQGHEDGDMVPLSVGNDSLTAVRLLSSLRAKLHMHIPMHFLHEYSDVDSLGVALSNLTQGNTASALDHSRNGDLISTSSVSAQERALIISDIEFNPFQKRRKLEVEHLRDQLCSDNDAITDNRGILLTGASGFIGSYLFVECRRQLPQHHIYVLMRRKSPTKALPVIDPLQGVLTIKGLWKQDYQGHYTVVYGDVSLYNMGISANDWWKIRSKVEHVIHCAAEVNWIRSYSALRGSNVEAVHEIVRFVAGYNDHHDANGGIDVHEPPSLSFVSTLSVAAQRGAESNINNDIHDERSGGTLSLDEMLQQTPYAITKFVGEKIIQRWLPKILIRVIVSWVYEIMQLSSYGLRSKSLITYLLTCIV